jgi:hypothetical protein
MKKIHIRQQLELLVLFFYLIYVIEWIVYRFKGMSYNEAYMNISFEKEAYSNDRNLNYLKEKKLFSFIKYYKK